MNNLIIVKDFSEYLQKTPNNPYNAKALILMDGTTVSVQASQYHYSHPRKDIPYTEYTAFELGFPSREIPEILEYAEDSTDPTGTVYPYVPKEVIQHFVNKVGGIKDVLTVGQIV